MRTDTDLMIRITERFGDTTPTSDGLAHERTLPPQNGTPIPFESFEVPAHITTTQLSERLAQRSSSLAYDDKPIAAIRLFGLIQQALLRDALDWGEISDVIPLEIYAFVLRPADVDPGVYHITTAQYQRVADLPSSDHWEDLGVQREFAHAGAIVSAAGNLDQADSWAGTHGYRVLMGRAASTIYDIHLSSVAEGWVGTVFAGFIPSAVRVSLASDGASRQQVFATTVAMPLTTRRR